MGNTPSARTWRKGTTCVALSDALYTSLTSLCEERTELASAYFASCEPSEDIQRLKSGKELPPTSGGRPRLRQSRERKERTKRKRLSKKRAIPLDTCVRRGGQDDPDPDVPTGFVERVPDALMALPVELLHYVIQFVPLADLATFSLVSKAWRNFIHTCIRMDSPLTLEFPKNCYMYARVVRSKERRTHQIFVPSVQFHPKHSLDPESAEKAFLHDDGDTGASARVYNGGGGGEGDFVSYFQLRTVHSAYHTAQRAIGRFNDSNISTEYSSSGFGILGPLEMDCEEYYCLDPGCGGTRSGMATALRLLAHLPDTFTFRLRHRHYQQDCLVTTARGHVFYTLTIKGDSPTHSHTAEASSMLWVFAKAGLFVIDTENDLEEDLESAAWGIASWSASCCVGVTGEERRAALVLINVREDCADRNVREYVKRLGLAEKLDARGLAPSAHMIYHFHMCCASTGAGVKEAFHWLLTCLKPPPESEAKELDGG